MSFDDAQEKIELNDAQKRAFTSLVRAIKKCERANIYFYQALDNLGALNGDNVETIIDCELTSEYGTPVEDNCLQFLSYPCITLTNAWADDSHYVVFKAIVKGNTND